jgi:hypothetical protein
MSVFWFALLGLSVFVGGPVGAALVVGLWAVVAYLPGKKKEAAEEARFFEDSEEISELSHVRTTIDFEEMRMSMEFSAAGEPDETEVFDLERRGEGQWRHAYTSASAKETLKRYKATKEINAFYDEDRESRLLRNDWEPLEGRFASRVEVAYQRYLRSL